MHQKRVWYINFYGLVAIFMIFPYKVKKCLCMHACLCVCLSLCLSVEPLFLYIFLNGMKVILRFYFCYIIFHIKNSLRETNGSCAGRHKNIPLYCYEWVKIFWTSFHHIYVAQNVMKLTKLIKIHKSIFRKKVAWNVFMFHTKDHTLWLEVQFQL